MRSPEGAKFNSPGHRPGYEYHIRLSPERATYIIVHSPIHAISILRPFRASHPLYFGPGALPLAIILIPFRDKKSLVDADVKNRHNLKTKEFAFLTQI